MQPLEREQGDGRDAGGSYARSPFWDRESRLELAGCAHSLELQLARMESDPGEIADGNGQRQVPKTAAGVQILLNQNIYDCRGGRINEESDQVMIVNLMPSLLAMLRKIEERDDRSRQFGVIQQVEVAVKNGRVVMQKLPHERELKV